MMAIFDLSELQIRPGIDAGQADFDAGSSGVFTATTVRKRSFTAISSD
jgi:hypothetical protein